MFDHHLKNISKVWENEGYTYKDADIASVLRKKCKDAKILSGTSNQTIQQSTVLQNFFGLIRPVFGEAEENERLKLRVAQLEAELAVAKRIIEDVLKSLNSSVKMLNTVKK